MNDSGSRIGVGVEGVGSHLHEPGRECSKVIPALSGEWVLAEVYGVGWQLMRKYVTIF